MFINRKPGFRRKRGKILYIKKIFKSDFGIILCVGCWKKNYEQKINTSNFYE